MTSWFEECAQAISDLPTACDFEAFDLNLFDHRIRVYLQADSEVSNFKKAFYSPEALDPSSTPDLQIFCVDQRCLSLLPEPKFRTKAFDAFGNLVTLPEHQHLRVDHDNGILQAIDLKAGWGLFSVNRQSEMPSWYHFAPIRELLHFWCLANHFLLLHAGSIVHGSQSFLLLGQGGSGKSTTTLMALDEGFKTCGDDYLVVSPSTGLMQPLYRTLKLPRNSLFPMPRVLMNQASVFEPRTNKDVVYADGVFSKASVLTGLLLLNQKSSASNRQASVQEALIHGAFSSIAQIPVAASDLLSGVKLLLENTPCHHFSVGAGQAPLLEALKKLKTEEFAFDA